MKDGLFHFKRFSVSHIRSSMKVGVDGVLIGAWSDCSGERILDVGTGCGLIALMAAQRNPCAKVIGIDVDAESVSEASLNFGKSPWHSRLTAAEIPFDEFASGYKGCLDLIVSNPPYFDSGVRDFSTPRNVARHQGDLSPARLIDGASGLLSSGGRLSMIVPGGFLDTLSTHAEGIGMRLSRFCHVRTTESKAPKRVMLEFRRAGDVSHCHEETLTMFDGEGNPTLGYRALCGDFYLKF